jgi:hypothetical protein
MLHAVPTVRIYRGCPLRAILSMDLPERGNVGKEPDAVPWNGRRVQRWSYSYQGIAREKGFRKGTKCCSLDWKEGSRVGVILTMELP